MDREERRVNVGDIGRIEIRRLRTSEMEVGKPYAEVLDIFGKSASTFDFASWTVVAISRGIVGAV